MAKIQIEDLVKTYPLPDGDKPLLVLDNISISVQEGKIVTFFGPNGCGKTTLLRVLAGVEPFDSGRVRIDSLTPREAKTGLIFQNYSDSLMQWLTGYDNILFPYHLKKRRDALSDAKERLSRILSELGLDLPLDRFPYEMSGGQQQLLSILRTLIYKPDVILMDEPFSALDYQTRAFMQSILLELWRLEEMTILFISHDIEEAIYLADQLVLLGPLPAQVLRIYDIPFKRPRKQSLMET
ncbi:ATP-binding cassette domain-containing protein, partial [bacterium]|nr:ATP-binding cassette domain-containing protein [bacterium]